MAVPDGELNEWCSLQQNASLEARCAANVPKINAHNEDRINKRDAVEAINEIPS